MTCRLLWSLFKLNPTLCWFHGGLGLSAEGLYTVLCGAGIILSAAAALAVLHPLIFAVLWIINLSIVGVGQSFLPQPG
jgi:hypothetical protein